MLLTASQRATLCSDGTLYAMAAETWQAASPEFSLSSIYAPIFPP